MIKLLFFSIFAFVQGAAFTAMPSKCFTIDKFAVCERVLGDALVHNRSINWDTVDAVRTIR
jgi:hypothetical protein